MARFKREFLEENPMEEKLGYLDGFRFGLGIFTAWLLGLVLVSVVVVAALALTHR